MGCGISTRLNPEDATLSRQRMVDRPITDVNSPTSKSLDHHGGGDSVQSFGQRSRKSVSSQGKDVEQVGVGGEEKEQGEKEEEGHYHSDMLFFPGSPSFKDYCIASSDSRNQSFSDNFDDTDSSYSIKNGGDEDTINKPEDKKERKKKERRALGLRNVIHMGMPKRKRNLLNFGCYTSHASYHDSASDKMVEKTA